MPRQARKHADSGIYHVMFRGIDRQLIFKDTQDYLFMLEIIDECKEMCNFKLYAYCLMGNHVHLLIKTLDNSLESTMKRMIGRYVYWYNVKYKRVGHLMQDRFKSEPVEDDSYFLTVLRYIHQSPVKAQLCSKPEFYHFSSYTAYLSEDELVDTDFALSLMPLGEFIHYNNTTNKDSCLDISLTKRKAVTDDQAQETIHKISHCKTIVELQSLDDIKRARFLKKIHQKGVSVRQLSRLTGTTKGMVEKWIK